MYDGDSFRMYMCPCMGMFIGCDFGKGDSGWPTTLVEES